MKRSWAFLAAALLLAAVARGQSSEPVLIDMTAVRHKPGEVTLFTSKGAGHTWPGSHLGLFLRLFLGRTSTEIDATSRIWDFAQAHAGDA